MQVFISIKKCMLLIVGYISTFGGRKTNTLNIEQKLCSHNIPFCIDRNIWVLMIIIENRYASMLKKNVVLLIKYTTYNLYVTH